MHRSPPNPSDKSRLIYTFHMIEGGKGYVYDEKNWRVCTCWVKWEKAEASQVATHARDALPGFVLGLRERYCVTETAE